MTISISLVDVTMIDLMKNKNMMMMTTTMTMMMMMMTTTTMMMMMMMDTFEDKRTVSSKFKSGETGKEGRKQKHEV
jgi:hypothetical protein